MEFNKISKYFPIAILILIFLFSYYIRSVNIIPDKILSFDPVYQYRFTKYIVDYGHLPAWDELSYYVGRPVVNPTVLMWYVTAFIYLLVKGFGLSLKTVSAYMSAIYGAAIVIPAYLLGKELSNKYGGLLSAFLVGTAPQILIRTFGPSYDTDQIALFFILFTLYLGIYALKRKTVFSYSMLILGFLGFMLGWTQYWYTFFFIIFSLFIFILLKTFEKTEKKMLLKEKMLEGIKQLKKNIYGLIFSFLGISVFGYIIGFKPIESLLSLIGFATKPELMIVNISIAELQIVNITNLNTWMLAFGRFVTGIKILDISIFIIMLLSLFSAIYFSSKKDKIISSFIITMSLIGIFTIVRGIRFTEFSSAIILVVIGAGFPYIYDYLKKIDEFLPKLLVGLIVLFLFVGFSLGLQYGMNLGPDNNQNWESAWNFLRTEIPELSLVGTWWDPGHMVTGLAERRVIADGAHCPTGECMFGINDRITDLGKIFATNDESVSLKLLRKYQGDSPKIYWIASDDLIGKYQWLQYFGTGCDARTDKTCELYYQIPEQYVSYDSNGNPSMINYGNIIVINGFVPIPIYIEGRRAALFDEVLFYTNETNVESMRISDINQTQLIEQLKPLESQLGVRFTNKTVPLTIWIPRHFRYIVLIPKSLRNTVFTRQFFLEGKGLEHFKQVFRNEQVKIYEVVY